MNPVVKKILQILGYVITAVLAGFGGGSVA